MRKRFQKKIGLLLLAALVLNGCAEYGSRLGRGDGEPDSDGRNRGTQIQEAQVRGLSFRFQVDPEVFSLSFLTDDDTIPVSGGSRKRFVSDYRKEGESAAWRYPEEQVSVVLMRKEDYLSVEITSEKEGNNQFIWPESSAEQYYFPLGEGKRVPSKDEAWKSYLGGREIAVLEQFSMPFWISSSGEYSVLFIMEDPFRTNMNFTAELALSFSLSHEYPEIDAQKTNRFRVYLTDQNPVNAAKLYRNFVIENGTFKTLEQKAEENPNIRKLYGAPFVYLGGELFLILPEDIDWEAFRSALPAPGMEYLLSFAGSVENGSEFEAAVSEMKKQDYTAEYQKNVVCGYLSQLLEREDFWTPAVFTERSPELERLLEQGYDHLSRMDKIRVHKYALASSMPGVFSDPENWENESTVDLISGMKESGIENAWIALHGWEDAYAKPELVDKAEKLGYLIASYDSYHSIHEPGKEQWPTAKFEDTFLYEEASVTDKDGEKVSGFQKVGRKLNPTLSMPSVKKRMDEIMGNHLPFNSWFIDCDATGEVYDDYTPSHITTQREDRSARLERLSFIRDQYDLVIGSEGGNDFASSTIAFAHGIELPSFSWMDDDMKRNKDSEFYMGNYYNPAGGVTQNFSKRVLLKDEFRTIFVDPRYDIPLYKLVYNDSVITSYHWDWSTFKIQGATGERMVREVLYNVPPLYHLDAAEWERYREDITNHQAVWSEFARNAVRQEMTGFEYLQEDGSVQKTQYGESLAAVANFGSAAYRYGQIEIPACSVLIQADGQEAVYTPSVGEKNR